jgi:hypothetical protein
MYFKYFFKVEDDEIELSNWIILGIALDSRSSDIRKNAFEFYKDLDNNKYTISFDQEYIRDLFLENIDNKNIEKCLIDFKNLFYILALSTKNRDNYMFIILLFDDLVQFDIKNIEYYSEAFHMAYLHYIKENEIDDEIKDKLQNILEQYLKYKIDYKKNKEISIDDDSFASFIFSLEMKFKNKNKSILQLLNTDMENFNCKNLTSLIYLFKMLGYSYKDIEKVIVHIQNNFNREDFTDRVKDPRYICTSEIENAIVAIYKVYKKNLGVERLEEYYVKELISSFPDKGYSTAIDRPIEWLMFLIDKDIVSKDFYKKIHISNYKEKLISQLKYLFLIDEHKLLIGHKDRSRNMLIKFLIKTGNIKVILSVFKTFNFDENINAYIDLCDSLIHDKNVLKNYKNELIDILELLEKSSYKSMFLSAKLVLLNHKNLSDDELQNILLRIVSKDTIKSKLC